MLETLEKVDWVSLSHAYGPATDVPEMLRRIASSTPEDLYDAMEDLAGAILHQSSIYPATPYVAQFLIEILLEGHEHTRLAMLDMLTWIAGYASVRLEPAIPEPKYEWLPNVEGIPGCEHEDFQLFRTEGIHWGDYYKALKQHMHGEVRKSLPQCFPFLYNKDPEVRIAAAELLVQFPEDVRTIGTKMAQAFSQEEDDAVGAKILQGLGRLVAKGRQVLGTDFDTEPYLKLLNEEVLRPRGGRCAFAAATGLAFLLRRETPKAAIDVLAAGLVYPTDESLFGGAWNIYYSAMDALPYVEPDAAVKVFRLKLEMSPSVPYDSTALDVAEAMLDVAFGGKQVRGWSAGSVPDDDGVYEHNYVPGTLDYKCKDGRTHLVRYWHPPFVPVASITPLQLVALRAILDCEAFWKDRTNLFMLYGLPYERHRLEQLVS